MSAPPEPRMRWWGWGADGHDAPLPKAAAALLRDELGAGEGTLAPVALDAVELAEPALLADTRERLAAIVRAGNVRDDHLSRVSHAAGRSYPDLVRLRSGRTRTRRTRLSTPTRASRAPRVACADEGIAVIPFGGGTSVVGGVEALRGPFPAAISVDLARLSGLRAARGFTLGHFPQSFEFSTVGGWAATRAAGQASTGYGRIDELVVSLRAATPAGEMQTRAVPATAAGPDLRELLMRSEGALGIITDVTLRVRPRPPARRYEAWSLPSFGAGTEALRELEQSGVAPDVTRLSDEEETRLSLTLASGSLSTRAFRGYLAIRGRANACLAIIGFEDSETQISRRRATAGKILRRHGGLDLGSAPGAAWLRAATTGPTSATSC